MPKNKLNIDQLGQLIYEIRGQRVMFDSDLASIYGVETKALNRAVKRNLDRFPKDFVFQLTRRESEVLRYQIGTLKTGRGQHRKYLPCAFTEHGAIMAANVLNSARAVRWHLNRQNHASDSNLTSDVGPLTSDPPKDGFAAGAPITINE